MITAIETELRTAIVQASDGVRFTATSLDDEGVAAQLIEYIGGRCDDVLWPAPAREVRKLLAEGRGEEAIAVYFANVGQRWDGEWLVR